MKAEIFKSELKKISSQLRGLTLQFINSYSVRPYHSLREFGLATLSAEAEGLNVELRMAWTDSGAITVNSFAELQEMLNAGIVTGIQVEAREPRPATFGDYVYSFGSLD